MSRSAKNCRLKRPADGAERGSGVAALAALLEDMAEDKATRLRMLGRATVVLASSPEWVRREEARALFGIPNNQLVALAIAGKVTAKKFDTSLAGSAVVFRAADIRREMELLPDYADYLRTLAEASDAASNTTTNTNTTEEGEE